MHKKLLLASSALLATGLVTQVASADGHIDWDIVGELSAYATIAKPAQADNGSGFYKEATDAQFTAPDFADVSVDDDGLSLTFKQDNVSASIDLVDLANGSYNGSVSATSDDGITISGANDSSPSLSVSGNFGAIHFNGDSAIDFFDINGDDAAVGAGGAGNTVINAADTYDNESSFTFVSPTIAGGAQVAVSLLNIYNSAQYVATDGAFELKEAGAVDVELAAKYATGPITAFFGFGTFGGNLALGAKFSQNGISAAFGFSQYLTPVAYAAAASDDTSGDGSIDAAELAAAVVRAAEGADDTIATTQALAAASASGDGSAPGAKIIAAGYEASSTTATTREIGVAQTRGADTPDDATDDEFAVGVVETTTTTSTSTATSAEINADYADANKQGGISFSVGFKPGPVGASFGVLLPANSDKYSLDSYKAAGDNPNTFAEEDAYAQDVNTAAPTIAINFSYDVGPGDARLQILSEDAGVTVKTGVYAAF